MTYPIEFVEYLVQYHGSRDYFECHEILEDYWKEVDPGNKKSIWVGFILIAVSAYHHRRENLIGAEKTLKKAIVILDSASSNSVQSLGVNYRELLKILNNTLMKIQKKLPYSPLTLPLWSTELIVQCEKVCNQQGLQWNHPSLIVSDKIIHHHIMRDRSHIIQEREAQKESKQHLIKLTNTADHNSSNKHKKTNK